MILPFATKIYLPEAQFIEEETPKNQIVLMASQNDSVNSMDDINTWLGDTGRFAPCFVIRKDGLIYQLYDTKFWAYSIFIQAKNNKIPLKFKTPTCNERINQGIIPIMLDNSGGLIQKMGEWVNRQSQPIPIYDCQVYQNGFRGYTHFERFSYAQISALQMLLTFLKTGYPNIPLRATQTNFDLSTQALMKQAGLYSHSAFRTDRSDIHPQPELLAMFQTL